MKINKVTVKEIRGWMYDDVKHKTVSRVQNKEDG